MSSERELRERVAKAIRGTSPTPVPTWDALSGGQQQEWLKDADRAIAICREHYGAEIARLTAGRDEWESFCKEAERDHRSIGSRMSAEYYKLAAEGARLRQQRDELREGLEWALDIIKIDEEWFRENAPDVWASLDHEANRLAHERARRALRKEEGDA